MGKLVKVGCLAPLALFAMGAQAHAAKVVQFDMKDVFNEDVIVNGTTPANVDGSQETVDQEETSFITQGAARVLDDCAEDPDGLPNNGRFDGTGRHPRVDLGYENRKDGKNARRSPDGDRYRVSAGNLRYRSVHVFATTGNGSATMRVKLVYRGGATVTEFEVFDWFDDFTLGEYMLVDDRDRAHPEASECYDDDAAAIRGFEVEAKKNRRLRAVRIIRPGNDSSSVLNVFGMTGVRAR